MKIVSTLIAASLLCLPAALHGQADSPAPVSNSMPSNDFGFNLPTHLGTLSYSLTGSQMLETGSGSVDGSTALSGNLAYLSKSERFPFSAVYSGGLYFTTAPGYSNVETFQNLAMSQVFKTRSWVFVVSNYFSYLPASPTTGLSGVAGVGDVGITTTPVQGNLGPTEAILSNYSTRISNGLSGSATWQATPSLDFGGTGSWDILHFIGGQPGLDTYSISASVGPTYRIDARSSVGADAYYSHWYYPSYPNVGFESQGVSINYNRSWTRRLTSSVGFGPERTHGTTFTNIPAQPFSTIPWQWNFAGNASVSYATRTTGFTASYTRGVNGGSGITFGAITDSVGVGMNRPLNRDWLFGANASYSHSVNLVAYQGVKPTYDSVFGGVQVSRRLTETLSAYGSYTVIHQSASSTNGFQTGSAFVGTNNVFAVGITFAPAPLLSGR